MVPECKMNITLWDCKIFSTLNDPVVFIPTDVLRLKKVLSVITLL